MAELLYGFDPLCGWCYGIVPSLRRVVRDHPEVPVRLVMAGLVSGDRIGPYADLEPSIRAASERLQAVAGRAPSEAFFRLIARPGVTANSGPPSVAIAHVAGHAPEKALEFAHRVIEAHFEEGADLNDPAIYRPMLRSAGVDAPLPDIHDPCLAEAIWEAGRHIGLRSFPTLAVIRDGRAKILPPDYDPDSLSASVAKAVK